MLPTWEFYMLEKWASDLKLGLDKALLGLMLKHKEDSTKGRTCRQLSKEALGRVLKKVQREKGDV